MARTVSRRTFLLSSTATAVVSSGRRRARAVASANDKLTMGVIGCGGQGWTDANNILKAGGSGVALTALADPDERHLDEVSKDQARRGFKPDRYRDFRELLDRKDIDIVVVGTPDHWHAAATLLACQAGKDVYVEKPLAHNIHEGRAMVNAAAKYQRVVQVGQQQRSDPHFREAMEYLRRNNPPARPKPATQGPSETLRRGEGPLGVISRTETYNFDNNTPNGIGNPPDGKVPAEVDYDRWLGAARKRPFNPNRFHWSWRWFYDYGGGMVTDWNVHLQDIIHWGMNVDAPVSVYAIGGKRVLPDNAETPDIMDVVYEYKTLDNRVFTQIYSMGKCYQRGSHRDPVGSEFFGTEGSLFINRSKWMVIPSLNRRQVADPDHPGKKKTVEEKRIPAIEKPGSDSGVPHAQNFLTCVRSRRTADLNCPIEVGHRIATACHLGNIALKLRRKIWWDREKEMITLEDGTPDSAANIWLTREYRKGYELPQV